LGFTFIKNVDYADFMPVNNLKKSRQFFFFSPQQRNKGTKGTSKARHECLRY